MNNKATIILFLFARWRRSCVSMYDAMVLYFGVHENEVKHQCVCVCAACFT